MKCPSRGETRRRVHRTSLAGEGCAVLRALKRRWHYVYLALANDGSYYCGYALDPRARLAAHNRGEGAKALRGRKPVVLAYAKRFADKREALRFEIALKRRTHAYKAALSRRWRARAN
jgi:putative endonuclease